MATFLKTSSPTKNISPNSYKVNEAFLQTQTSNTKYTMNGKKTTSIDLAMKKSLETPGAGHYKLESLEKAFTKITSGASKGWK